MDGKTFIIAIAALILGGLGGFMLGGSQSQTVTQEKLQMMMSDPQTREMMVEEVMSNEDTKQMVNDKMMEKEDETMMEDTEPNDRIMDAETEDDSMMKDEDTMMKEDSTMER